MAVRSSFFAALIEKSIITATSIITVHIRHIIRINKLPTLANVIFIKRLRTSAAASLKTAPVTFIFLPFYHLQYKSILNTQKYNGHNTHGGEIMPERSEDDVKIYIPKDNSEKASQDEALPLQSEQRP